ncbi:MAG: hypothetical protein M1825_002245 [Sarcosagium campestre]|nr:MAG: hypothetical protein M1825_002245 [Sarcosagium campestre]
MRFSSAFLLALAAEATLASSWFSKAAYNKWHETELERWLSDHDIPYPSPADRKDLENIVKDNWQSKVSAPYQNWDAAQIQAYLKDRGQEAQKTTEKNTDGLIAQIKNSWYETEDQAQESYNSVKDWIFDSWTESQLKAFLDKNGIPAPQPRKRDTLIASARENYEIAGKKVGETVAYPGNWLYESWSESDLKAWLDERGIPAPQPSSRDKLIASVRRNARVASLKVQETERNVSDAVLDTWSDSTIKEWADKNGIKVPQGSKRNELVALVRKHRANTVSSFGAATSKVNNEAARATDDAKLKSEEAFNSVIGSWSDSRLKAYLDARGVPVPQNGKRDELTRLVRLNSHKAASGWTAWTFDTWTTDNLKSYLGTQGDKASKQAAKKKDITRDELVKQAQAAYSSASKAGGTSYASVTSALAQATSYVKDSSFETWTNSELKAYLDGYGVPVPQGTKTEELKALARRQATYFRYGTSSPSGTVLAKLQLAGQWVLDQLKIGAASGRQEAGYQTEKGAEYLKQNAAAASKQAAEATQKGRDRLKQEL